MLHTWQVFPLSPRPVVGLCGPFVLTKSFQQWHISSCLVQSNAGNTGPTESDWKLCAVNSFWGVLNAQPLLGLMEGLFSFFLLVSSAVSTVFPVFESQTLHPVALSFSHHKFKYVTHTHRDVCERASFPTNGRKL